jgi:glycerophosphoryl diester phosphodiesterase
MPQVAFLARKHWLRILELAGNPRATSALQLGPGAARRRQSSWLSAIESLPTLRDLLEYVPLTVGFNLEVKYPCRDRHQALRPTPDFDLNAYVDRVLQDVFDFVGPRRLVFSCFDPDVCTALRVKQARYPVLFLTTGGAELDYRDVRSRSLLASARFAGLDGLDGIVTDSEFIMHDMSLVARARALAGVVLTYGDANTDPMGVSRQREAGVDAVISDNIGDVTRALGKPRTAEAALMP